MAALANEEKAAADQLVAVYTNALQEIENDYAKILDGTSPLVGSADNINARLAVIAGRAQFYQQQIAKFADPDSAMEAMMVLAPNAYDLGQQYALDQLDGVGASLVKPNRRTVEQSLAGLQSGTVWRDYFNGFAKAATDDVVQALTTGVALGEGIDQIVKRAAGTVNMTTARLRTAVRTQVLDSARMGTLDTYRENASVVKAWIWRCNESTTTCGVCWAMNGTEFPLSVRMATHPNCRCYMTPKTRTFEEIGQEYGMDLADVPETGVTGFDADALFNKRLTPVQQRAVLGPTRHQLWVDQKITLRDMVDRTVSPTWGPGLRLRSVKECVDISQGTIKPTKVLLKPTGGPGTKKPKAPPEPPQAGQTVAEILDLPDIPEPSVGDVDLAAIDGLYIDAKTVLGTKTGGPAGSNTGGPTGFWTGTDGVKRYVKMYDNAEQAIGEVVANELYRRLGVAVPRSRITIWTDDAGNQRILVSNDIMDNQGTLQALGVTKEQAEEVLQGIVPDTWLANWDAVGTGLDNIVVLNNGTLARIDQGGSLLFRAQGKLKPDGPLLKANLQDFWTTNPYYRKIIEKAGHGKATDVPGLDAQLQAIVKVVDDAGGVDKLVQGIVKDIGEQATSKGASLQGAGSSADKIAKVLTKRLEDLQAQINPPTVIDRVAAGVARKSTVQKARESAAQLLQAGKTKQQAVAALKKQGFPKYAAQHAVDKEWQVITGQPPLPATQVQKAYDLAVFGLQSDVSVKDIVEALQAQGISKLTAKKAIKQAQLDTAKPRIKPGTGTPAPDMAPPPAPARGRGTRASTTPAQRPADAPRTITEAQARIDSGDGAVNFQWDGDGIEGLDVRVRPATVDGQDGWYQVRFKVRGAARTRLNEQATDNAYPIMVRDGSRVQFFTSPAGSASEAARGVQRALGRTHRTYRWSSNDEHGFGLDADGTTATGGEVTVFMRGPLTDARFKSVLDRFNVVHRAPTRDDELALAENALAFYFRTRRGGSKEDALARARRDFGIGPEDVVFRYDERGRMMPYLSDEALQRVQQRTGVTGFTHRIQNGEITRSVDGWVQFLSNPDGLLSTTERWGTGVNSSGMSSIADIGTGGGDYVFFRQAKRVRAGANEIVLRRQALGRLDLFAFEDDNYGRVSRAGDTIDNLTTFGSSRETMFKHRVGWDEIETVYVPARYHEEILTNLQARGIQTLGGRPLRDVIKPD